MLLGGEDTGYGFGKDKQKINHLLFMDDLKFMEVQWMSWNV
jgi:hypothetical protein